MKHSRLEGYFSYLAERHNYDSRLFSSVLEGYEFTERFAEPKHSEIEFGKFAGSDKHFRVTGEPLDEELYARHLQEVLPAQKKGMNCAKLHCGELTGLLASAERPAADRLQPH